MTASQAVTGEKAFDLHQDLVAFRAYTKKEDWELAKRLYVLRRRELWRFAVGGFDSWEDYLKQPELGISRHKADKLVRIYEHFIGNGSWKVEDLAEVPWYALDFISKKGSGLASEEDLLDAAKHLSQKDWKETYFDLADGRDRTYSYLVMRKCDQTGNLEKVHELDSQTIKTKLGLDD